MMCVVRTIFIIMVAAKLKQELGSSNFGIFFAECHYVHRLSLKMEDPAYEKCQVNKDWTDMMRSILRDRVQNQG